MIQIIIDLAHDREGLDALLQELGAPPRDRIVAIYEAGEDAQRNADEPLFTGHAPACGFAGVSHAGIVDRWGIRVQTKVAPIPADQIAKSVFDVLRGVRREHERNSDGLS